MICSVPTKGDNIFSPTSAIVRTIENLTHQKITNSPVKPILTTILFWVGHGIAVSSVSCLNATGIDIITSSF